MRVSPLLSSSTTSSLSTRQQRLQSQQQQQQRRSRYKFDNVTLYDCGGHRQTSRSVSWNSTGAWLALASSDRLAKIWSLEAASSSGSSFSSGGSGREYTAITGHSATVERVRFHPTEPTIICTAAEDRTVRAWDIRSPSRGASSIGKIDLISSSRYGGCPASIEWHPGGGGSGGGRYLAVTEKNDCVHVYDVRNSSSSSSSSSWKPVKSFDLQPHQLQECHFSPTGQHLVAATKSGIDGMGEIRIWRWDDDHHDDKTTITTLKDHSSSSSSSSPPPPKKKQKYTPATQTKNVFVGHTGPIYTLRFSPDGTRLATGGSDALVGLWDVNTMVCASTITRRTKFVRSVSYSFDSRFVACSSEEDGVDVADAYDGMEVGIVSLSSSGGGGGGEQSQGGVGQGRGYQQQQSMSMQGGGGGGADEIAFHPKAYLLACARGDPSFSSSNPATSSSMSIGGAGMMGGSGGGMSMSLQSQPNQSQVTIAKLNLSVV